MKAIPVTESCNVSDTAAVSAPNGATEVTDLGPGDSVGATVAQFEMIFSRAGAHKICYKLAGGTYEMVGAEVLMVSGAPPTSFTYDGKVKAGAAQIFTMNGGGGLQLGPQKDEMKAVQAADPCSGNTAGGTIIDDNLGPNYANGATAATCQFTWQQPGSYQLCYRTLGGNYTKVSTRPQLAVASLHPPGISTQACMHPWAPAASPWRLQSMASIMGTQMLMAFKTPTKSD